VRVLEAADPSRVMAERLVAEGSELEVGFGIFGSYERLPQAEEVFTEHLKLTGAPELVVAQELLPLLAQSSRAA
jgi:hypothetical protein